MPAAKAAKTAITNASIANANNTAISTKPPARVLTDAQLLAIPLLVTGKTGREVAAQLGVGEDTISRWRTSHEAFIDEYERQRTLVYNSGLQAAYSVVDRQLQSPDDRTSAFAAKTRLDHHAQMQRANVHVTHTVVLDQLIGALANSNADAIEAEFTAIADGTESSTETSETNPDAI